MDIKQVYSILLKKIEGVATGFVGSETDANGDVYVKFADGSKQKMRSIKGDKGDKGDSFTYDDFTDEQLEALNGKDGKNGNTVQVLDNPTNPIKAEAVLILDPSDIKSADTYSKAQSDVKFAKSVEVGNITKLTVNTWSDLVSAINDVFGRGMGGYRFEVDENKKALTIVCRNGVEVPIDISQIILNTNIEEFKDMLVTNLLDGQSLVYSASKKKWVNKSIDSSGMLVEAKAYTDEEIKKFNNKGSIACDDKPTYYGGVITYRKGGETRTTEETGTWFYYFDENDKAVQTIFVEGTEFTIAMAGDVNLDEYVAKTSLADVFDETFVDKSKVPTTRYIEELKGTIDDDLGEKVNVTDIIDTLNSDATDKPLSAKQGKELDSTKLNKTTDVENKGKALVVDESGNIVFGDAGVKVSSEEGNKITEKGDGIFVASEIDDENISEDSTFSSKKINDSLVDIEDDLGEKADKSDVDALSEKISDLITVESVNITIGTTQYESLYYNDNGFSKKGQLLSLNVKNVSGNHFVVPEVTATRDTSMTVRSWSKVGNITYTLDLVWLKI